MVNTIIGSGIFGIPSPLNAVVGRASPLAMIFAGIGMGLMLGCFAEVSSRFSEPGGAYLYTRTAFGRFAGIQIGWFSWLAPMGTSAAAANLFTEYLSAYFPFAASVAGRVMVIVAIFALLAIANVLGVQVGANLSSVFTVAKLLPLGLLIVLGTAYFFHHPQTYAQARPAPSAISPWIDAMLLLSFAYGGFENAVLPAGEVRDARRNIPFALVTGLVLCIAVYSLAQFVAVATVGTAPVQRPFAAAASLLIGSGGAIFITIAAMISSFGHLSAVALATPRLTYSLAERHDFPRAFGAVHARFQTPYVSILVFVSLTTLLAVSGTFRWAIAMASGALVIIYGSVCASLIKLRRSSSPDAALKLPAGEAVAVFCMVVAVVLLARLTLREGFLLLVTFAVASVHWFFVRRGRTTVGDAAEKGHAA